MRRAARARGPLAEGRPRGFGIAAGLDPDVGARACAPLRGARLRVAVVERPPGGERARDRRRLRRRPRREPDVGVAVLALDRHAPGRRRGQARRGRHPARRACGSASAPGSPSARSASCARGSRRCGRALPQARADRRRRDGAEDVRARGRRGRRRVPQLDDAREGRLGARARARGRAEAGRPEPPPVFGYVRVAVGDGRRASACARRSPSTASCTRATSATSRRSRAGGDGRHRGATTRPRCRNALAAYDAIDHVVVRALAHADADSLGEVAEAAAPGRSSER